VFVDFEAPPASQHWRINDPISVRGRLRDNDNGEQYVVGGHLPECFVLTGAIEYNWPIRLRAAINAYLQHPVILTGVAAGWNRSRNMSGADFRCAYQMNVENLVFG